MAERTFQSTNHWLPAIPEPGKVVVICSGSTLLGSPAKDFQELGLDICEVCSEAQALLQIGGGNVKAVLIDSRLRSIPAPEIVEAIHRHSKVPIFVAVEGSDSGHRIGYDSLANGASGLLSVPVGIDALVRSLGSTGISENGQELAVPRDGLEYSPSSMTLSVPGGRIHLNQREAEVIQLLLDASPQTVTIDQLMRLWDGKGQQPDRNARMAVVRIRQKLGQAVSGGEQFLQTVRGRGYRLSDPERPLY